MWQKSTPGPNFDLMITPRRIGALKLRKVDGLCMRVDFRNSSATVMSPRLVPVRSCVSEEAPFQRHDHPKSQRFAPADREIRAFRARARFREGCRGAEREPAHHSYEPCEGDITAL